MLEIQVLGWDGHKNVAGLNLLMGSPPPLDNWISNSNTYIKKQKNKPAEICFHSKKKTTYYHKKE
jgi:hypothetical protein